MVYKVYTNLYQPYKHGNFEGGSYWSMAYGCTARTAQRPLWAHPFWCHRQSAGDWRDDGREEKKFTTVTGDLVQSKRTVGSLYFTEILEKYGNISYKYYLSTFEILLLAIIP